MASNKRAAGSTDSHLVWLRTRVEGRPAAYGVAGEGLPVVFLHGWALSQTTYKRALRRLVDMGCRVYAPALPGFGGSADLPRDRLSFEGYASWVASFLDAVGVDERAFVIGHSFGGGVGIRFAHDHPERVRTLVLVNSLGGSAWRGTGSAVRSMAERPLWDWGIHFPRDVLPLPQLTRVLPVVLEDFVPNAVRNPRAVWRVANLARSADLRPELEVIKERGLPVVVLWGDKDSIVPRASFDALCEAIGTEGEVIAGHHSWMLADPDAFGEVMTNSITVAKLARDLEAQEVATGRRRRRRSAQPRAVPRLAPTGTDDSTA